MNSPVMAPVKTRPPAVVSVPPKFGMSKGISHFRSEEQLIDAADAARHRDILLTVQLVGDRLADDAGAGLELPQLAAVLGVIGDELAGHGAREDQTAGGGQRSAEVRDVEGDLPL